MNPTSAAIKVGITALVMAILGFGAFKFVAKGMQGGKGYVVWALFRDATGLVAKSRVQVAGLSVGEIIDRRLEGNYARVSIRIRPDVKLWSNAALFKKSATLLGEYYLEIDPGTVESPDPLTGEIKQNKPLGDSDQVLSVIEAVTPGDILVQVNDTLPVLREILKDVQRITQGPLQEITKTVQTSLEKNSLAVEKLLGHMDEVTLNVKGLTQGQLAEDLRQTVSNARAISDDIRGIVGKGEGELSSTGAKIRQDLDKVGTAVDNLNRTLDNMAAITGKMKNGEGTVGRLLNDPVIADNVETFTEDVGSFLRPITRLQTLVGLRTEYNVIAGQLKTYVGIQLAPRPDKYYQIELIDDPRGTRTRETTYSSSDDPTRPQTVRTDTVKVSSAFRFTVMFAKRLFLLGGKLNLVGRLGIKESTGGAGIDVEMPMSVTRGWFRTFQLTADIFDFRANIYPRLKVLAALEFYKHLWIVGGVDDALNNNAQTSGLGGYAGRDYFFGAQLAFNDEDLRSWLAIGGAALVGSSSGSR